MYWNGFNEDLSHEASSRVLLSVTKVRKILTDGKNSLKSLVVQKLLKYCKLTMQALQVKIKWKLK